jgi:hypothetical protein
MRFSMRKPACSFVVSVAPEELRGPVGMTNLKAVAKFEFVRGKGAQQVPPLRYPGFPVELSGVGEVRAAFFKESRIRGCLWFREVGNPGTLRSG